MYRKILSGITALSTPRGAPSLPVHGRWGHGKRSAHVHFWSKPLMHWEQASVYIIYLCGYTCIYTYIYKNIYKNVCNTVCDKSQGPEVRSCLFPSLQKISLVNRLMNHLTHSSLCSFLFYFPMPSLLLPAAGQLPSSQILLLLFYLPALHGQVTTSTLSSHPKLLSSGSSENTQLSHPGHWGWFICTGSLERVKSQWKNYS